MATVYADRAFVNINGAKVYDLQSASVKQNFNAKPVKSMTDDKFNRGFVEGNTDIDVMLQIALQNTLARPKIESLPFGTADISITFICGADQYVLTGIFRKDVEDNAGGIGDEAKGTFNLGALKLLDAVGNSSLLNISL